jgi:multidrug resistance efflux pump
MKILGRHVHLPASLLLGLGTGLFGACALTLVVPTRGEPSQTKTAPRAAEQPAARSDAPAAGASKAGKPATARVEKGPFKIEVTSSGVFEAKRMTEVSIRPKVWAMPMVVEQAVELGTPVKKGDILVEFDRGKIEKTIQDSEAENALAELAVKQAQEELPALEQALPVDLAAAERSKAQADEDLKRFRETDRPQAERNAQFAVKRSAEYLEYSKEELRQLEKMYRSKDLTEETEEIILRRQRFQVESGEFYRKEAELQRDHALKIDLPRREERAVENTVKQSIDLAKARALLPLNVSQKRLTLAKLKYDHARSAEKLADLRQDRDAMTVHAPADGIVYYGRCERGHWSAAATAPKLHKGGVIAPDETFITIVAPRPVEIRATVDEKDLFVLAQPKELKGVVIPAFDPEHRLPVRLASILPVPREAGKFEAAVAVEIGDDHSGIKPGMACTVKFVPYRKEDALTIPSTAVFEDDSADLSTNYVYLAQPGAGGKFPRRQVKTGKTSAGKTEILDGLSAGDEVLTSKP